MLAKFKSPNIKEVLPTTSAFMLGLDYLLAKRPANMPMIACYEGYATHNFASGIMFELTGKIYSEKDFLSPA